MLDVCIPLLLRVLQVLLARGPGLLAVESTSALKLVEAGVLLLKRRDPDGPGQRGWSRTEESMSGGRGMVEVSRRGAET